GTGDHLHFAAADARTANVDDRARFVPFARNELVGLQDVQRPLDARQRIEHLGIELALVANRADQRALGAARNVDVEPVRPNLRLDGGDFGLARVGLHDDDHLSLHVVTSKKIGRPFWSRPIDLISLFCRLLRSRAALGVSDVKIDEARPATGQRLRREMDEFSPHVLQSSTPACAGRKRMRMDAWARTPSGTRMATSGPHQEATMSALLFHMIGGAPDPVAPFSHAVEADGWVFLTGQMPFTGTSNTSDYPETIEAQTHQVMQNLRAVLNGCGLGFEHVAAVRIFLRHFDEHYA